MGVAGGGGGRELPKVWSVSLSGGGCKYLDLWKDDSVVGKGHCAQRPQSVKGLCGASPKDAVILGCRLLCFGIVVVASCAPILQHEHNSCCDAVAQLTVTV